MSSQDSESLEEMIDIPSYVQGLRNLECEILQCQVQRERQDRQDYLRPIVQKLLVKIRKAVLRQESEVTFSRLSDPNIQTFHEMTGISLTLDYYIRDSVKAKYKFNLHGHEN